MAITYSQVAARINPGAAHAIWPYAYEPRARLAEASLGKAAPTTARTIRIHAQRLLLGDPLRLVAARTAGLAAGLAGDSKGARDLIAYAQKLSRRDLATQVALIEFAVADNDVPKALHHYDIALRGSDAADQLLMPLLVSAARDPIVARALQPILAARPPWRLRFVYSLIEAKPWSQTFLPILISAQLSVALPQEQDFLRRATQGLVGEGSIAQAAKLYAAATGRFPGNGVNNGDFRHDDRLPPFDWQLVDDPGLTALKGPVDGAPAGNVISIIANGEQHGVAAKQLLSLTPGEKILRFRAGAIPAGRNAGPSVELTCNSKASPVLANVEAPSADLRGSWISAHLKVPGGCTTQWLSVIPGTTDDTSPLASPWLGWFTIEAA